MAKVKITGHASGSGVITVTAPNTSTDRVITLPDSTSTLATTAEAFNPDAAQVFNESGADVDFRVEGSNEANALFVQGSDGNVGIGTNTPTGFEIRDKVIRISKQSSVTAYRIIGNDKGNDLAIQSSDTADGTAYTSRLNIMNDGRGLSQFTAKAWAVFMTDTTNPSFRDSHNCSSITDHAVGQVTVNYTNNMGQNAHVVVASAGHSTTDPSNRTVAIVPVNSGSARLEIYAIDGNHQDMAYVSMLAFGD